MGVFLHENWVFFRYIISLFVLLYLVTESPCNVIKGEQNSITVEKIDKIDVNQFFWFDFLVGDDEFGFLVRFFG